MQSCFWPRLDTNLKLNLEKLDFLETFLYLCTDNFIITIIHLPLLGEAHELELLSTV